MKLIRKNNNTLYPNNFKIVFGIALLSNLGMCMTNALVSSYVDQIGGTISEVGMIGSAFALTALLLKPISGPTINSFDRKKILMFSNTLMTLSSCVLFLSQSVYQVLLARMILGCGFALTIATNLTLASEMADGDNLSKVISTFSLSEVLASAIGPTLGIKLNTMFNMKTVFAIAIIFNFTALLLTFVLPNIKQKAKVKEHRKVSLKGMFERKSIPAALMLLFLGITNASIGSYALLYFTDIGITDSSLYFTLSAIVIIFSKPLLNYLLNKIDENKILIASLIFLFAAFVLMGMNSWTLILVSSIIYAIGKGICHPLLQAKGMEDVEEDRRGSASATCYTGSDLGSFFGPIICSQLVSSLNYSFMFICMTVFIILIYIINVLFNRSNNFHNNVETN